MNHNSSYVESVNTAIHVGNYYALSFDILELKINEDFLPYTEYDPILYSLGDGVDVTEHLYTTIQGYVDTSTIDQAIATSATILEVPSCGVLISRASTLAD